MKSVALSALLGALLATPAFAAVDCSTRFRFEANARLTPEEAVAYSPARIVRIAGGPTLGVMLTSWEDPYYRGDWAAMAVVYAQGAGASPAIGGVLWVKDRASFGAEAGAYPRVGPEEAAIVFRPLDADPACPKGFTVRLDRQGVMTAGRERVGRIP